MRRVPWCSPLFLSLALVNCLMLFALAAPHGLPNFGMKVSRLFIVDGHLGAEIWPWRARPTAKGSVIATKRSAARGGRCRDAISLAWQISLQHDRSEEVCF